MPFSPQSQRDAENISVVLKLNLSLASGVSTSQALLSFAFLCASVPLCLCGCVVNVLLIASVVLKLQINPKILRSQHRNYFLERVTIFSADPHRISLD